MSTYINISVGDNKLLNQANLQQNASRQAQIEKEANKRLKAQAAAERIKALVAKGLNANGNPLQGTSSPQPEVDRRPAASRFGQGLNLGHIWVFGDKVNQTKNTGIISATNGGYSYTQVDGIRSSVNNILIGCGNGGAWEVFEDVGYVEVPLLPADTFSGSSPSARIPNPTSPPSADAFMYGLRTGGSVVNTDIRRFQVALPCGRGNFIFIYGFASIWDAYQATAPHTVTIRYEQTDINQTIDEYPFYGYGNPATNQWQATIADQIQVGGEGGSISFQGYRGKQRRFAAYLCSNSSIRQINIPSAIQPFLDAVCPEPVDFSRTVYIYNQLNPDGAFTHNVYRLPIPTAIIGASIGLETDAGDSAVYTPDVFKSINDSISFTNPASVKTIPTKLYQGLADRSAGAWQAFQDTSTSPKYPWMSRFYREGNPFYYALWPNKNEEPNLQIWDPAYAPVWENSPKPKRVQKATLTLRPDRVPRDGANDSNNLYGPTAYNTEELISVWDWDDPAYCRSMCLAIGFTEADLTP